MKISLPARSAWRARDALRAQTTRRRASDRKSIANRFDPQDKRERHDRK
jgi:hypothetical protein